MASGSEPLRRYPTISLPVIALLGAIISAALTYFALQYARARNIIDHPNERSSHNRPTPRGGGIAIVITFLAGVIVLAILEVIPARIACALLGGGILVSGVGWLDDARGLSASARGIAHLVAAFWALWWLEGLDRVWLLGDVEVGMLGWAFGIIGIVWWINLYNFMDGIDGIAAGQAVTVAGFAGLLLLARGDNATASLAILLAAAAFGFLVWNWPPARIFMGDVGSGFLGYVFAVLAIASEKAKSLTLVFWLVLSGVFVFDATLTLIRRILRREPFWSAHRTHAYQRLVSILNGHAPVTSAVLVVNLGLALIVYFAVRHSEWSGPAMILAIVLLGGGYLWVERVAPMSRYGVRRESD